MGLGLAIKAFFKAWREPQKAAAFLEEAPPTKPAKEDLAHLKLLASLQRSGRLIDFFKEEIKDFDDAQIGAAVRQIHQDCAQALEELVTIRPVMEQAEGTMVTVPKGYDSSSMKIVGKVKGEPPYTGTLVHRGWQAKKRSLPKNIGDPSDEIIAPAEIEIQA